MQLTTINVENVFHTCLHNSIDAIKVEGILSAATFATQALNAFKDDIDSMLDQLPDAFHESGGGGMSFLNMCVDKNGEQWADFHLVMEKLLMLGIAIDRVAFNAPKILWKALPGGMPYVYIKNKSNEAIQSKGMD